MQLGSINNLKKYYGDRLLLDIDKFEIMDGDRIGIVGENGVGKTTLIKILIGEIKSDEGTTYITDSYSYISQREAWCEIEGSGKVKGMFHVPDEYDDYLSGGEKVKMRIVKAFEENSSLIIADEPTSNLDVESVKLLNKLFKKYKGALLIISHDRNFLDDLCNKIVEIEDGKLTIYNGSYSDYLNQREENRKVNEREYNKYIHEKSRLEKAISEKEVLRDRIKKAPKGMGPSEAKTIKMGDQRGKKNIDNNIKSIKSRIDHLEIKEKPKDKKEIIINIVPSMKLNSKIPIEVNDSKIYVKNKLLIDDVNLKIKQGRKIALLGENGCGKTTLLKHIINGNSDKVKISSNVKIGYFDQGQSILDDYKSILENIKEDSSYDETFIRINLSEFGFKDKSVYKRVGDLSGGERVKVGLCKVILSDNNILILDEPTNYLDIKSIEALENALVNTDKTIVLVSHDIRFISNICDYIIEIKENKLHEFDGGYSFYVEHKNIEKIDTNKKKCEEELLVLNNRLTEVISLLSLETDETKKVELDAEYKDLLYKIKNIQK
ncbi:ABC-F type ribosomal protection protein CplR [Clostridium sp. D46t1_190503_E9]|uniref:ABC-F type ribosomal protection protein CplR n=1 Tax=Clostridium sp. D46t1_190503_E9 TaxID=2787137 RepID=UPI0018999DC7|nr:ABC-F type ribosomal protection protein CplR [Clostridium sp. D46t1_190503_E9]